MEFAESISRDFSRRTRQTEDKSFRERESFEEKDPNLRYVETLLISV